MNEYMKVANDLEEKNNLTNLGGPFGAVVVKNGKIVGKGSNCVVGSNDPTAHAEIMAIRNACKELNTFDLSGCELYTSCYPCPMCLSAIIWSNIKKVYYGNTKEDAAEIGFRDDMIYKYIERLSRNKEEKNIIELIPIDREETIKAFEEFKNKESKANY